VFRRIVELVAEVESDAASARYENGMLRIELPLLQRTAPPHEVPIETGEGGRDKITGGDR
jgi:HSP20 family molecular chaperone IbpA